MTRATAKSVSDLMISIGKQLTQSLDQVKNSESDETFLQYRTVVSRLLTDMLIEVMNPLYAEHPDLKPTELS